MRDAAGERSEHFELLALAELRPGEVPGEELLHEAPELRALLLRRAHEAFGIAHRVGGLLLGVVLVVGGASSGRLSLMGLDEFAPKVGAHQPPVRSHPNLFSDVAGRYRVDGAAELDVVIGMDLTLTPGRRIKAPTFKWSKRGLLDLEAHNGFFAK